jgi:regulator of sigma E protease
MIVVLAGAFMNIVLGFVLLITTTCSDPYLIRNTIHGFHEQATSNSCGLQEGDTILSLNGSRIFTITDLQYKMSNEAGEPFTVVVKRNGEKVTLENVTFLDQENNDWLDFSLETEEKTVWNVMAYAAKDTVATSKLIWMSLVELVNGKYGIQDLSGPVGTVEVISDAATVGETMAERVSSVLHLTIFITINVGIFNLLPIPGLDGSRFLFLLLEAIRRKPVKKEHEAMVHLVGMAALFLLMIVVTAQDVTRIFHS